MFTKINYLYITIIGLFLASNCFAASDSNLPYKEGELLVKFAPKANGKQKTTNERNQILASLNVGEVKHLFKRVSGLTLVKLPENLKVKDALSNLKGKGGILYVEPNYKIKLLSTIPNDTDFNDLWGMHNTGQNSGTIDADIDAPEAWDIIHDACDIIVAVIDTGVDYTHPDLAANMWVNQAELNGITGVDDDGNGYIDDIYGYDFVEDDADPTPWGNDAHGTACAGIAAGATNNGAGIAGVAWGCKIMPIRVAYVYNGSWYTTEEWLAGGIQWAADHGADVLSNSWGGGSDSDIIHNSIINANNNGRNGKGCVVVFASGNSYGPVSFPATYPEVIAVGATDKNDARWSYSNYGSELDVVAPSGDGPYNATTIFWATDIVGSAGKNGGDTSQGDAAGNYWKWMSGTSAACPQVAGAAALILSVQPLLTSDEVQNIIQKTTDDKGDTGWDQYYGWGRLNLYNALLATPLICLINTDDAPADGVKPNDRLTYTIPYNYSASGQGTLTNVVLTDYLPNEIVHNSISDVEVSNGGSYSLQTNSATWTLDSLDPGDSCSVTVTVTIGSSKYLFTGAFWDNT
ncbi:MAG: S8 family serine peptidase [Phycisphaerae bacterium]|jgi:subtilisin family serine protease